MAAIHCFPVCQALRRHSHRRVLILAGFVGAIADRPGLLLDLLQQDGRATIRTGVSDRLIPGGEFAFRIAGATIESFASFGPPHDNLSAATLFRAGDTQGLPLDKFAIGIITTCGELPIAAMLDDQLGAALRAL